MSTHQTTLLPSISKRWSPRAFSQKPVSDSDLLGLLEAARWAPSCFGAEPWRFILGIRGAGDHHEAIAGTLMPVNRVWAENAPVLLVAIYRESFEHNGEPNAWAAHDVGLAVGQLGIEATARGLVIHQMGGFDAQQASELLGIPAGFRAITTIAIGYAGQAEQLPEELAQRERAPRTRKPLDELAFEGQFGTAFKR